MDIREYDSSTDFEELRRCVIELQDFERTLDARLPAGEEIADEYIAEMLQRCWHSEGRVLVAADGAIVAGYACIMNRVQSNDLDDGDIEFGLVADLLVRKAYRGRGLGGRLLQAAEDYARAHGVQWLRVSVMAANETAGRLYRAAGFEPLYAELEKRLDDAG